MVKTKAFIISRNRVIATCETELDNNSEIRFAYLVAKEQINANFDYNLVNAKKGKISRAKKWDNNKNFDVDFASEINHADFHIISD